MKHLLVALIILVGCAGLSCGPVQYSYHVLKATGSMARAEETGAEELAPYEFHYADEHLKQARREVGHSDFQAAVKCAKVAREYANKAVDISKRRRREQGR